MENIAEILGKAKVLVVGDVMMDTYIMGDTKRVSPEAPVPVVKAVKEEQKVGGAANVALNTSSMGAKSILLGITGEDQTADDLKEILSRNGVDIFLKQLKNRKTITKLRIISRNQQLLRLDFEEPFFFDPEILEIEFKNLIQRANAIIFSDYDKGTLKDIQKLIYIAKEKNIPLIVDPKGNKFEKYKNSTIVTPNFSEFELVVGKCENEEEIIRKGNQLVEHLKLEALLITRSSKGMTLIQKNKKSINLPTFAKEVYDVTGAGDTVVASLGAGLGAGMNILDAVNLSNYAAGIVVGKLGTSTVDIQEISEILNNKKYTEKYIQNENELINFLKISKKQIKKIVFTNGCFDLIHPGHIDYLRKAKEFGDLLIVGINSDKSITRIKGKDRPINNLETRIKNLEAFPFIDKIISFDEDTPESLINSIVPDVLVKGADYSIEEVVGREVVQKSGGKVITIDLLQGFSSSKIIDKILKLNNTNN